jgi:hypothetical protein
VPFWAKWHKYYKIQHHRAAGVRQDRRVNRPPSQRVLTTAPPSTQLRLPPAYVLCPAIDAASYLHRPTAALHTRCLALCTEGVWHFAHKGWCLILHHLELHRCPILHHLELLPVIWCPKKLQNTKSGALKLLFGALFYMTCWRCS